MRRRRFFYWVKKMKQIEILYFAWIRERIGQPKDQWTTNSDTIAGLVAELCKRGPEFKAAFHDLAAIRVAINQEMASLESSFHDGCEVAFFPPMTGG